MNEDFGNSWRHLKTALLLGGAMGSIGLVTAQVIAWLNASTPDYPEALGGSLFVASVFPMITAMTMLFSIRIEDNVISQRLLRIWQVNQGRMEDLARVEFGCAKAAARLHFTNGACVSLPMADDRELQALCVRLLESRPDFDRFVFGARAARVEKVVQSFRAATVHARPAAQHRPHDRAEPGVATRAIPWGGLRRTRVA